MTRFIIFRGVLGFFSLATLMLLSGCFSAQSLSGGNVPCKQDEMEIVDEKWLIGEEPTVVDKTVRMVRKMKGQLVSWTVICRDKRYYCRATYSEYSGRHVNCINADE